MIHITLPDGSVRAYEAGITSMDIAKSIVPNNELREGQGNLSFFIFCVKQKNKLNKE